MKKKTINSVNNRKNKAISEIGILGYGEVGQAIAKFYSKPKIKDLTRDDDLTGIKILHITIPWSDKFIGIVESEMRQLSPKLTIIHSTVAVGTTKKIIKDTGYPVVHSPVRGVHPDLHKGIKTFVKYIGAEDRKAAGLAEKHLKSLGIKTRVFIPSTTTELGKLMDTTYYGLCIAWHGEAEKFCKKYGVDFEKAMADFNRTYNEGYTRLGKKNVIRPVLYSPKNGIGGHCVVQNSKILAEVFKSEALNLILKYRSIPKNHERTYKPTRTEKRLYSKRNKS